MLYSRRKEVVQGYQIGSDTPPDWLMDEIVSHRAVLDVSGAVTVVHNSTRRTAHIGDWLVRYDNGTIEKLSDDRFKAIYEPATIYDEAKVKRGRRL
jgi:hypothetical protein